MSRALTVWWDDAEVGELALNDHGVMIFRYAKTWLDDPRAPAISVSLPKQAEAFSRAHTRPFFAGLLPEERPRTEAARALGVSQQNDFGLLEGLGGDVAGALTLWPCGETVPRPDPGGEARVQDEAALAAILDTLPRRPLLAGEEGIRLSLAGAQPKVPVVLLDGAVALPAPGQPTTHIIKPAPREWPTFPENEAFCMRLAGEPHAEGLVLRERGPLARSWLDDVGRRLTRGRQGHGTIEEDDRHLRLRACKRQPDPLLPGQQRTSGQRVENGRQGRLVLHPGLAPRVRPGNGFATGPQRQGAGDVPPQSFQKAEVVLLRHAQRPGGFRPGPFLGQEAGEEGAGVRAAERLRLLRQGDRDRRRARIVEPCLRIAKDHDAVVVQSEFADLGVIPPDRQRAAHAAGPPTSSCAGSTVMRRPSALRT